MKYAPFALTLLLAACSFTPNSRDASMDAGFHPPIIGEHGWHVDRATLPNGTKVCSLSTGYNGLTVFLSSLNGEKSTAVKSNRMMQPGSTLTVNAGGSSFEAYDTFFSPKVAPDLVDHLAKGGQAYLEWSEFSGPSGRERMHVQNIAQLGDFAGDLKQCQGFLGAGSHG